MPSWASLRESPRCPLHWTLRGGGVHPAGRPRTLSHLARTGSRSVAAVPVLGNMSPVSELTLEQGDLPRHRSRGAAVFRPRYHAAPRPRSSSRRHVADRVDRLGRRRRRLLRPGPASPEPPEAGSMPAQPRAWRTGSTGMPFVDERPAVFQLRPIFELPWKFVQIELQSRQKSATRMDHWPLCHRELVLFKLYPGFHLTKCHTTMRDSTVELPGHARDDVTKGDRPWSSRNSVPPGSG